MNEKTQKLVDHLQNIIDGIKDGSISVDSVSATTGDALTIDKTRATYSNVLTFEFHKKTTL